jgi:secreted PhoX family phosphatase
LWFQYRCSPASGHTCFTALQITASCFSPDGTTLFVNMQRRGLTVAITGPWEGMA